MSTTQKPNNIVEVGLRGTGKSAIGRRLATITGRELFETDKMTAKLMGQSIPDAVEAHGWGYFRAHESAVLASLEDTTDAIISTGGGIVTIPENIPPLRNLGFVAWLHAPADVLERRITNDPNRPKLTSETTLLSELTVLEQQRTRLYLDVMDVRIDTERNSINQAATLILYLMDKTPY
jgi:shikimate kinase